MKKIWTVCIGSWLTLSALGQHQKKVLFVIADGIPADVLERLHTPHLDAIGTYIRAHVGGDKGTYSETPTISAVGYNSLLTGTWANKHNVWHNYHRDVPWNAGHRARTRRQRGMQRHVHNNRCRRHCSVGDE